MTYPEILIRLLHSILQDFQRIPENLYEKDFLNILNTMFVQISAEGQVLLQEGTPFEGSGLKIESGELDGTYGLSIEGCTVKAVKAVVPIGNAQVFPEVTLEEDGVLVRFTTINRRIEKTSFGIDLLLESTKLPEKPSLSKLLGKVRI